MGSYLDPALNNKWVAIKGVLGLGYNSICKPLSKVNLSILPYHFIFYSQEILNFRYALNNFVPHLSSTVSANSDCSYIF